MAYNSSYITLVNGFHALENASQVIKAVIPVSATIQLGQDEYCPGEVIHGTVSIEHRHRFQLYGMLAVLNGTIKSNVTVRTRKWIDSVTNLHVFTFLVKGERPGQDVVMVPNSGGSPTVYPFSLPIPETNLPASFQSPHGSIVYRVQLVIGGSGIYKVFGEHEFKMAPYFNLNLFTSPKMLAKQSWQTKDGIFVKDRLKFKIIEVNLRGKSASSGLTMTKSEDAGSAGGSMLNSLLHKGARLGLTFTIPSISYCIGDEIQFRILLDNPNADRVTEVQVVLLNRIIYTAMKSKLTTRQITSAVFTPTNGTKGRIEWSDAVQIPSDLTITSSLVTATVNQPIIFQYILSVLVQRDGKEPFEAETLLCVGTTADALLKARKLIIDLETCKYPLGYTEMSYPEDWEQMCKSGRFGYVSNANVVIGEGVNPRTQHLNRTMSILSISKAPASAPGSELPCGVSMGRPSRSGSFSAASCTSSNPPAYSGLSSRRSSCISLLPPAYNQVVEEKGINEENNTDEN